jgi:hypothetical protein
MLEGGPRLTGGGDAAIRRVRDLALEPLALHTTGAGLLYDDDAGRRRLACAALSFQPGPPGSGAAPGGGGCWFRLQSACDRLRLR